MYMSASIRNKGITVQFDIADCMLRCSSIEARDAWKGYEDISACVNSGSLYTQPCKCTIVGPSQGVLNQEVSFREVLLKCTCM